MALVAAFGALIGMRYRAPALLLATGLILTTCFTLGVAGGAGVWPSLLRSLASGVALQFGYAAGALAGILWRDRRR